MHCQCLNGLESIHFSSPAAAMFVENEFNSCVGDVVGYVTVDHLSLIVIVIILLHTSTVVLVRWLLRLLLIICPSSSSSSSLPDPLLPLGSRDTQEPVGANTQTQTHTHTPTHPHTHTHTHTHTNTLSNKHTAQKSACVQSHTPTQKLSEYTHTYTYTHLYLDASLTL